MTLAEFEVQRATLACQFCHRVGLEVRQVANNIGAVCPGCDSKVPLPGVQWLKQNGATDRKARKSLGFTPGDVWAANGDHCSFCGKPRWLLERLKIHPTMQHVVPVIFGGEESSPLIPFCARCQEASAAALKETRNLLGEIDTLDSIIRRIETNHPELRDGR